MCIKFYRKRLWFNSTLFIKCEVVTPIRVGEAIITEASLAKARKCERYLALVK